MRDVGIWCNTAPHDMYASPLRVCTRWRERLWCELAQSQLQHPRIMQHQAAPVCQGRYLRLDPLRLLPQPLQRGLVKITFENLGMLDPDPWYSSYHHSHPTLMERLTAIDDKAKKAQ